MDLREQVDKQLTATCPSEIGKAAFLLGNLAWCCLFQAAMTPDNRREPPSQPLTGGPRLELLTAVCSVGLTHAGRSEVRVGSQDGRQVDDCG